MKGVSGVLGIGFYLVIIEIAFVLELFSIKYVVRDRVLGLVVVVIFKCIGYCWV